LDSLANDIGNVQKWQADFLFDVVGHFVDGIGTNHQKIGSGCFERFCRLYEFHFKFRPLARVLKLFNVLEVEGIDNALGRMVLPELGVNPRIDN